MGCIFVYIQAAYSADAFSSASENVNLQQFYKQGFLYNILEDFERVSALLIGEVIL